MGRLALGVWFTAVYASGLLTLAQAHRLNRAEYSNTVRDLSGVDLKLAADLPPDDSGYGFDNIGEVLTLSPALMERYFAAADRITSNSDFQKKLLVCGAERLEPHGCARRIVSAFARRAYRRPVTAAEVDRLMQFVDQAEQEGDSLDNGVLLAVRAVLVSPNFLFRIERDPGSDVELASRLSYFLWSSMPDGELLEAAEEGRLHQRGELEAQVRRMLADPKSAALVRNFGGQWLEFRNLDQARPDRKLFPSFGWKLRNDMRRETVLFFEAILREDRSIFDFIDADFTFLNERLAQHYGIEGVTGEEFRRVKLEGGQRGGVLTQASVLTVTSYPNRTSPVLRGKFLLANILGAPPPPPPASVPGLGEAGAATHATMRQQIEEHRANPACAVCHTRMDPLGFALENYDAIGRWRASDGETPIDASATLPDGRSFSGPEGLRQVLKARPDAFRDALASKMLTYALGRGLEASDRPAIEGIRQRLAAHGDRFSELVLGIVESAPFEMRSGDGP